MDREELIDGTYDPCEDTQTTLESTILVEYVELM